MVYNDMKNGHVMALLHVIGICEYIISKAKHQCLQVGFNRYALLQDYVLTTLTLSARVNIKIYELLTPVYN